MDSFLVTANGRLEGSVKISGAKNAVLPVMAAAMLADGISTISNVPRLKDTQTMANVLRVTGCRVKEDGNDLSIDSSDINYLEAPYELVKTMRASFYMLGPLVAKFGKCRVSLPGGCAWGPRPVDLHLKGLEALGANINVTHGYVEALCKGRLKGNTFSFPISSVGATANILMAATLAEGTSILQNSSIEPEITALAEYLTGMGADINGIGTRTLIVKGVEKLKPGNGQTIADRIEAGTFLAAAAITRGKVRVTDMVPEHQNAVLEIFRNMGCEIITGDNWVELNAEGKELSPAHITALPYPGFPTDMQAQLMAVLATVKGTSSVRDTIYADRFKHVSELERLGAEISLKEDTAVINGGNELTGAQVMASDLRASAALVLAGLVAKGQTEISRIYHLDRGYENFEEKLSSLGAKVERKALLSILHFPLVLISALFFFLNMQGCTCCAYFNHAWNMEEAYEGAAELRQARLDSLPDDSTFGVGKETELYGRVLEKGSRTIERFPKNDRQVSKSVYMMGEAFRYKGEWRNAIEKYDELERYFPEHDSMPKAEYERAYCLYKDREYALARFSAEHILEKGEKHHYYLSALELMSLLQEKEGLQGDAIESLEKVLATGFGTPWTRAKARMRLAGLYYEQKNYLKAREHYMHKELFILSVPERYKAQSTAAECLVMAGNAGELPAANEYKALADSVVFKDKRNLSLTRQGEILLSINYESGIGILRNVAYSEPKTEMAARAFFGIGDFRQKGKAYPEAILFYDSSFQSKPSSSWGNESYARKAALSKLLSLKDTIDILRKSEKPFFPQEFQIAELFLLKLSETDSALALLARMDSTLEDPSLRARAAYTRAFIYDDFKQDSSNAYPLYRKIIENYPQTNYAKQAQANMGLQVSIKTNEDLAYDSFLKAEEAWLKAQKIPLENFEEIDLAYQNVIALYDSVIVKFPETEAYLRAMFAKACILAYEIGNINDAQSIFIVLSGKHNKTPWGKAAAEKLGGRISIREGDLNNMRKIIESLVISTKQQSDRYWQEAEKKQNEPPPPKIADDEVLMNDYNTLYDFK